MPGKGFHWWWTILPSAVFFLLVAVWVARLAKRGEVATEVASSPTPAVFPQAPPPVTTSGLSSLVGQIEGWRVDDPRLATPVFDRKISLPAE